MIDPKELEVGGEYKDLDGNDIKIIAHFPDQTYPWIGVRRNLGNWVPESWSVDGEWSCSGPKASRNIAKRKPKKVTRHLWINCYGRGVLGEEDWCWMFRDRGKADGQAGPGRIACIKREITFEHGEGLTDETK